MAVRTFLIGTVLWIVSAVNAVAVETPPAHHSWGRFKPGSWQRVRVTTETFGSGDSKSVEIIVITTRLIKVEADGYVVSCEEKAGDRVTKRTMAKYAWDGSMPNDSTREKFSLGEVQIEGKTYACQTQLVTTKADGITTVTKSWYCPDHAPYFLKRLTRVTGQHRETTVTTVIRRAVTKSVLNRKFDCWESETKYSTPDTTSATTTYSSLKVPGGLVLSQSEVSGRQQGRKKKVHVELIAFEAAR